MSAERRMLRAFAVFTTAALLTSACSGGERTAGGGIEFEFSVARDVRQKLGATDDQSEYPHDCVVRPAGQKVQYSFPSGAIRDFQVDTDARLRLKSAPVKIMLTEYDDEISQSFVAARALLHVDDLEAALSFRERYRHCTVLVSVNGNSVWVDENGSRWSSAIPAGAYESEEKARSQLASGPWPVVWEEWPSLQRSMRFWSWRRAMDIWEYACKEEIRQAVDAAHPEAAKAAELIRKELEGIDCSAPPVMEQ